MNIVGLDCLVFGVDDLEACGQFLTDYGLIAQHVSSDFARYEALDGTAVEIYHAEDKRLPEALPTACMLRQTVYGVDNSETLDALEDELARDRVLVRKEDGAIETVDDMGFAIRFQVSIRKEVDVPEEIVNAPGTKLKRDVNVIGADPRAEAIPRTLSHLVYFVPDLAKAEKFYSERLGFRVVDRFEDMGPFMRPAGMDDHHSLFMIETPAHMQGVEHFTFHMANPSDLLVAGKRFQDKGYESFWGPGRHVFGSNWFWYFNSPLNTHIEYDADMDRHDDNWEPRVAHSSVDSTQIFNFTLKPNWYPGADIN